MANFIWKGRIHACNWESIKKPKSEGGLGLRKLQDLNTAASLELFWRCATANGIWSTWMRETCIKNESVRDMDFITGVRQLASMHICVPSSDEPDT